MGGIDEERILVENLVQEYIMKESCIVLVTITCESAFFLSGLFNLILIGCLLADFENQPTYAFARQFDPDGSRIVGEDISDTHPCPIIRL